MTELLRKTAFREPVLNMDETELRVLKVGGKPSDKKC